MKKVLMMVLFVVLAVSLAACAKQSVSPVPASDPKMKPVIEPNAWMMFDSVPLKMDAERALTLGLHETTLTKPIRVFNYMGTQNGKVRWQPETLPAGTKVLIGEDGIPLYKRDCWNKLFVPVTLKPVSVTPVAPIIKRGFWATGFGTILAWILMALAILLGILLISYLLFGIACVNRQIFRALRWTMDRGGDNTTPTPPVNPTDAWSMHVSCDRNRRVHVDLNGVESFSISPLNKGTAIEAQIPAEKKTPRR